MIVFYFQSSDDTPSAIALSHYLLDDGHLVVVTDGVFTQEVELNHELAAVQLLVQGDVLDSQRAAAHRVCRFALLLLIASPQCKLYVSRRARKKKENS